MSLQQSRYLLARANGATMYSAAAESGIGIGEARLIENDIVRGDITLPEPGPAPEPVTTEGEPEMPRGKKAAEPQDEEIKKPDFELAVRIFRQDIKPAVEAAGEHAQEASTGYKAIKNDAHVNTRAAKFVFKLANESEEKRNDVLRSLRGLLEAMNIGITDDLVSRAEDEDAAPIVPVAAGEKLDLHTVQ